MSPAPSTLLPYTKLSGDTRRRQLELDGWRFFSRYYRKVPHLHASDSVSDIVIHYENLSHHGHPAICDALASDQRCDITAVWEDLRNIADDFAEQRQAEGGTQLFYLARSGRLSRPDLLRAYQEFARNHPSVSVNGIDVVIDPGLIQSVLRQLPDLNEGYCAPSQGDYHERNIFTNGYIVDFEAAGWNLIATDIATFVWHTLYAGSHFGPRYADWSPADDKVAAQATPVPQLRYAYGKVSVEISPARKQLLQTFVDSYLTQISSDLYDESDVRTALAFRLLSMFHPEAMTADDQVLVFALANLHFGTSKPLAALLAKLA